MKRIYFIDSENVGDSWLPLLSRMEDDILVFYTSKSPYMNYDGLVLLKQSPKDVTFIKCFEGTNALDFQLVSELGFRLNSEQASEFVIVTNDTGYDAAVRYWQQKKYPVRRVPSKAVKTLLEPELPVKKEIPQVPQRQEISQGSQKQELPQVSAQKKEIEQVSQKQEISETQEAKSASEDQETWEISIKQDTVVLSSKTEEKPRQQTETQRLSRREQWKQRQQRRLQRQREKAAAIEEILPKAKEAETAHAAEIVNGTETAITGELLTEKAFDHNSTDAAGIVDVMPAPEYAEKAESSKEREIRTAEVPEKVSEIAEVPEKVSETVSEIAEVPVGYPEKEAETAEETENASEIVPEIAGVTMVSSDAATETAEESQNPSKTVQKTEEEPQMSSETAIEPEEESEKSFETMIEPEEGPGKSFETAIEPEEEPEKSFETVIEPEEEPEKPSETMPETIEVPHIIAEIGLMDAEEPGLFEEIKSEVEEEPKTPVEISERENENSEGSAQRAEKEEEVPDKAVFNKEEVDCLINCIGRQNLGDLHNALELFYGETGKEFYQKVKSSSYDVELQNWSEKERFFNYCGLVFAHSELQEKKPEEFEAFLYSVEEKRKNLNTLRSALQKKYGKEQGLRYYSLFKAHIKVLNRM